VKKRGGDRYFSAHTRPWISDADFDARGDPCIWYEHAPSTAPSSVQRRDHGDGAGGYERTRLVPADVAGYLDRLAARRYIDDPRRDRLVDAV
jgi:hypothetical protein